MSGPGGAPTRVVHCTDAVGWLLAQGRLAGCSLVTSLPDVSELGGMALEAWRGWFTSTAALVMRAAPDDGVAIFYQTDIKRDGAWVDKGFLCLKAGEAEGLRLLWHKVVCRHPPGSVSFGRPGWAHMLCFSRGVRLEPGRSGPDVLASPGAVLWTRGMGLDACALACRFVRDQTPTRTVVDPFCGLGTVLAVANGLGLHAVGVERSRRRAQRAQALRL